MCGQPLRRHMPLPIADGSWFISSPQQGTRTIRTYMQEVKHNIDSLTLMNVPVDFDELFLRVLNGLELSYSNLSHALHVWETPVAFEELFKNFLNYKAQLQNLVPLAPPLSIPATAVLFAWFLVPSLIEQPWRP